MKNKLWLISLIDIMISASLTFIISVLAKVILDYLYRFYPSATVYWMWEVWRLIKYEFLGGALWICMIASIFTSIYLSITYKKNKKLEKIVNENEVMTKSLKHIIDETKIMADGKLDESIEGDFNGDIKTLVDYINSISTQLKNRTIEERKAQKTKNDLITNVSHDLRTPLTSIMGYLELIDNDKYDDELRLRYYANIAYEKSKSLNVLINDLFELTKMQNDVVNLNKSNINLVELLGQVVAYFEYQFKKENVKSRVNFSEDKLIINADAEKLVRAFENLLSNAIKYGKDGYYIDVKTKAKESMAVVQIINYGESIPEVDLEYIFDRFYRAEKSRNSAIGGSGLGLSITKNIIELHNGSISAYSDDKKTIFEVRLPIIKG